MNPYELPPSNVTDSPAQALDCGRHFIAASGLAVDLTCQECNGGRETMNDFITDKRSDKFPPELIQAWADRNEIDFADERAQFGWLCGWPDQFNAFVAGWIARLSVVNLRQSIAEIPTVDFDSDGEELIRRDDVLALLKA